MARAGYDPRQMANMFRTIEAQGRSGAPEWLSDHPNPGNRHDAILREAETLRVDEPGARGTPRRGPQPARRMAPAPTTQQIARAQERGRQPAPVGTSGRAARVEAPSRQWRTVEPGDFVRLNVPANWREVSSGGGTIAYAPDGGYFQGQNGESTFTHGLEIGVMQTDGGSLQQTTEDLLQCSPGRTRICGARVVTRGRTSADVTRHDDVEQRVGGYRRARGDQRVNRAPERRQPDVPVGRGPSDQANTYFDTFSRVRQSVQLMDRGR